MGEGLVFLGGEEGGVEEVMAPFKTKKVVVFLLLFDLKEKTKNKKQKKKKKKKEKE